MPHQNGYSPFMLTMDIIETAMSSLKANVPKKLLGNVYKMMSKFPLPSFLNSHSTDEFGLDPTLVWYLRPFFQFLYYNYFRVDTQGVLNIPVEKPAIIVANHAGGIPYDGVMVHLAIYNEHPRDGCVRFLAHDFAFRLPLLKCIVERLGGVPATPENALRLLNHGHLVLIFPEGLNGIAKGYEQRYQLQRFGRGGFVRLAIRTGAPVIPTAIIGSEEIHPIVWTSNELGKPLGLPYLPMTPTFPWLGPLGFIPLPTKWRIIFGEPISFSHLNPSDADNEPLIKKEAENVRGIMQKMINAALAKRKSIWY